MIYALLSLSTGPTWLVFEVWCRFRESTGRHAKARRPLWLLLPVRAAGKHTAERAERNQVVHRAGSQPAGEVTA